LHLLPTRYTFSASLRTLAGHETEPEGTLDAQVAWVMERQEGVAALAQLIALGLGDAAIRKRARAGRLHRIYQAVYALAPHSLLSVKGRYMAAVLAGGPGAALSHRSAADLHGLRRTERAGIDVIVVDEPALLEEARAAEVTWQRAGRDAISPSSGDDAGLSRRSRRRGGGVPRRP